MKKLIYLVVAGFIFVFSACGGGASTGEGTTDPEPQDTTEETAPGAAAEAQEAADVAAEEAEAEDDAGDGASE